MKTCCVCQQTKSSHAFKADKRSKDGLTGICRFCVNQRLRASYQQDRVGPLEKLCPVCGEVKPIDNFYRDGRHSTGRQTYCQRCQYDKVLGHKRRHPERYLLANAKRRAQAKGVPFSLEEKDIVIPENCPVLGFRLTVCATMAQRPDSASIDEIIPGLGYVPGNVAVISFRANSLKRDGTHEELELLVDWLRRQVPSAR